MVVGAQFAFQVVIDHLALFRIAADQMRGEHQALAERRLGPDPMGDVSALQPVIGADAERIPRDGRLSALHILHIPHPGRAVARDAEIVDLVGERDDVDAVDLAHLPPLFL